MTKSTRHSDEQSWAEEEAYKIVNIVCEIVYDDSPTSFDGLDFSEIATALRSARNRGLEEAAKEVLGTLHGPYVCDCLNGVSAEEHIAESIRALREVL